MSPTFEVVMAADHGGQGPRDARGSQLESGCGCSDGRWESYLRDILTVLLLR